LSMVNDASGEIPPKRGAPAGWKWAQPRRGLPADRHIRKKLSHCFSA